MKRIISILLLAVLCFNIIGYKFFAQYFENQAVQDFQLTLSGKRYQDKDLILIKLPLNLAYWDNWDQFEEVEGNIDYQGINYQYVKKRIFNDMLEIYCLPNVQISHIKNLVKDYEKQLAGSKNGTDSQKSTSIKVFKSHVTDWVKEHVMASICFISPKNSQATYFYLLKSIRGGISRFDHPPEAIV